MKFEHKYFKEIDNGNNNAIIELAKLYDNNGRYRNAESFYLLYINKYLKSLINEINKETEYMKYILLIRKYEQEYISTLYCLVINYMRQNKYLLVEQYSELIVNKYLNCKYYKDDELYSEILLTIGKFYINYKRFELAEQYLLLGASNNYLSSILSFI